MKVAVWDTYVQKSNGTIMHFDILVPEAVGDHKVIYDYGQRYLAKKGQQGKQLDSRECKFCHIEEASAEMIASISAEGFHIIEMEGCD
jgi:hypothetical protein